MTCTNCKQSLADHPEKVHYRTEPFGSTPANWMCKTCIQRSSKGFQKKVAKIYSDEDKRRKQISLRTSKTE